MNHGSGTSNRRIKNLIKMGGHTTKMDLSKHWEVEIKDQTLKERTINITAKSPFDGSDVHFHLTYKNPTNLLKDTSWKTGMWHVGEPTIFWQPVDHAIDFEVFEGVKLARGQIIGMIIDEDVGLMGKIAWHPETEEHNPRFFLYQTDIWRRDWDMAQEVLKGSLGLGNVCLLIQNGKATVLDDELAKSDANCVFHPGVDKRLNDFRLFKRAKTNSSEESESSNNSESSN